MNRKILLVDDEPLLLEAINRLLRKSCEIYTAQSGELALDMLFQEGPFAVIISDYKMPGMDGIELLSRVQKIFPNVMRIMLTGQSDMQTAIDAINLGAVFRFLTKPCSNEQIQTVIEEAIEQYSFIQKNRHESEEVILRHGQKRMFQNSVDAISLMLSRRDPYTAQHQIRVAALVASLCERLGVTGEVAERAFIAARVHDIGKFFIPSDILTRPGKISDVEFMLIKTHSRNGFEILTMLDFYQPIAEIVYQHHERIDGTGYPRGLHDEEIMLEARILAVADVVEAMYSHRPYRPARGSFEALNEIRENSGTLYDSMVVEACLDIFDARLFEFSEA